MPPATNLARFAIILEERYGEKLGVLEFRKLMRPGDIAADIGMINAIVRSQKNTDLTIFYAGIEHILNIQDLLLDDYRILIEKDLDMI